MCALPPRLKASTTWSWFSVRVPGFKDWKYHSTKGEVCCATTTDPLCNKGSIFEDPTGPSKLARYLYCKGSRKKVLNVLEKLEAPILHVPMLHKEPPKGNEFARILFVLEHEREEIYPSPALKFCIEDLGPRLQSHMRVNCIAEHIKTGRAH